MWVDEIENNLPNGFHDAIIRKFEIDLVLRKIEIVLDVDKSDVSDNGEYVYKKGLLEVLSFGFCNIEQPNKNGNDLTCELRITSTGNIDDISTQQGEYQSFYFYIPCWNSFLKFTGKSAKFSWLE